MENKLARAEILVHGLVQRVGFRFFVLTKAKQLNLKGFTKNLMTGEVLTEVEGEEYLIKDLFKELKIGPAHAQVTKANIHWSEYKNEFKNFEIRY